MQASWLAKQHFEEGIIVQLCSLLIIG